MMRLDRFLSEKTELSRKELKAAVKCGRAHVNGAAVNDPEMKIDPEKDVVAFDGYELTYRSSVTVMLNKPAGVLTAARDSKQKTVLDLLPRELVREGAMPAGRLDKDTTGLLIITSDGDLAHRIISPRQHIKKVYLAETELPVTGEDVEAFRAGLVLADGLRCLPAELEPLAGRQCLVTVYEGKYHQVKRMLASRGKRVTALKRLSIGSLTLPEDMPEGGFVELSQKEIDKIFS